MLHKNQPSDIKENAPWEGDVLNRKSIAGYLTPAIASIRQPFVISLNAPYGTGKTDFITRWQKHLEMEGYCTAYFNAWETDFSDEPFLAFMACMDKQLEKGQVKNLARSAGMLIKSIAPTAVKIAARAAFGKIPESLSNVESIEDLANLFADTTERLLSQEKEKLEQMEKFKKSLRDFVLHINKGSTEDKKKIIVFVDDLDRCRPTYAIEILEHIKHLFSVSGMVFILAIDDPQLQSTIKSVYGSGFDADGYLRRFIDWRFILPKPSYMEFSRFLSQKFGLKKTGRFTEKTPSSSLEVLENWFAYFSQILDLSLREQEQCFTEINLSVRCLKDGQTPFSDALAAFVTIRAKSRAAAKEAAKTHTMYNGLFNFLRERELLKNDHITIQIENSDAAQKSWYIDEKALSSHKNTRGRNRLEGAQLEREIAIHQPFSEHQSELENSYIAQVVFNRLENAARFLGETNKTLEKGDSK